MLWRPVAVLASQMQSAAWEGKQRHVSAQSSDPVEMAGWGISPAGAEEGADRQLDHSLLAPMVAMAIHQEIRQLV
jgi:hypothetical protein